MYLVIYDAAYMVIFSFVILFGYEGICGIQDLSAVSFIALPAAAAVMIFIRHTDRKGREIALIIILALISGAWIFRKNEGMLELLAAASALLPALLSAAGGFMLICASRKIPLLKAAAVIAAAALMVYFMIDRRSISSVNAAFFYIFILLYMVELIQARSCKKGYTAREGHTAGMLPFVLIFMTVLMVLPAPRKPFDWTFVKKACIAVREELITISQHIIRTGQENYLPAYSGFSENGNLFASVHADSSEVMTVKLKEDSKQPGKLYLAGKVFDSFDGRMWEQRAESKEYDARSTDAVETMYAVESRFPENDGDYCRMNSITVTYRYFSSAYVFAPLKTFEGKTPLVPRRRSYGDSYDVRYICLNSHNKEFMQLFREEQTNTAVSLSLLSKQYGDGSFKGNSDAGLSEYRKNIKKMYLHDIRPSAKVTDYLENVTAGADTDFDKLRAIERALSGMKYDTAPGALPENVRDGATFLDYFLFESRKGFCSHYATAFVLLANSEGIPARYVQGFMVKVKPGETAAVTSDMAHAWPEAYIEGFGWMSFEPTPGYGSSAEDGWEMSNDTGTVSQPVIMPVIPEKSEISPPVTDSAGRHRKVSPVIPAAIAGIAVFMLLIFMAADRLFAVQRFKAMNCSQKFSYQYERNNKILYYLGFTRKSTETLSEFHARCSRDFGEAPTEYMKCYERKVFGNHEILSEDYEKAFTAEKDILADACRQRGRRLLPLRAWLFMTKRS